MATKTKIEEKGVEWTESLKFSTGLTTIDAASYNRWAREVCPMAFDLPTITSGKWMDKALKVDEQHFLVRNRLPKMVRKHRHRLDMTGYMGRATLEIFQGSKHGKIQFTGAADIPVLFRQTQYGRKVVMSLTPMEIISQRGGIRRSKGHTVIGGLGMGWIARRCLEREKVKHVTVVERNKDIVRVFGQPLKDEFGDKLTLVTKDIYDFLDGELKLDMLLMDIWDDGSDWELDSQFRTVQMLYGNRVWRWGISSSY
jgi:hypothetical protein